MSDGAIRLCRHHPSGQCNPDCAMLVRATGMCRLHPNPPKRWSERELAIEIPFEEWRMGERGNGESEVTA